MFVKVLFFTLMGYLLGSILFGYWIPKILKNIDVRNMSLDSNPGTANAFKNAGVLCGIIVLFGDLAKGFFPIWLAKHWISLTHPCFIFVLIAPVLGHAFPIFDIRKGGKAIAVSFGVLTGLLPDYRFIVALAFFYLFFSLIVVIESHFYRSIVTYLCFFLTGIFFQFGWILNLSFGLISCIVIYKHVIKYEGEHFKIHLGFWRKINI